MPVDPTGTGSDDLDFIQELYERDDNRGEAEQTTATQVPTETPGSKFSD
jgi:hypothetical protein